MTAKVTTRYRFPDVNFEPQNRLLIWQDGSTNQLSEEESRLLNILCHYAGETLSYQALYYAARLSTTTFYQHQNNLSTLLAKSFHHGDKKLPLEVVSHFGYRIALPKIANFDDKPKTVVDLSASSQKENHTDDHLPQKKLNKRSWIFVSIISGIGSAIVVLFQLVN